MPKGCEYFRKPLYNPQSTPPDLCNLCDSVCVCPSSFLFLSLAFFEVGGYNALLEKYRLALPSMYQSLEPQLYNISPQCFTPENDAFQLLGPALAGGPLWHHHRGRLVLVHRPGK